MLYQRHSAKFELMNLEESEGSGSGSVSGLADRGQTDKSVPQKHSCKQQHHRSFSKFDIERNEGELSKSLNLNCQKRGDSEDNIMRHYNQLSGVRSPKSSEKSMCISKDSFVKKFWTQSSKKENEMTTLPLQPNYYQTFQPHYGLPIATNNIVEKSPTSSCHVENLTKTGSISDMISDNYDNEDNDSYAIYYNKQTQLFQSYNESHQQGQKLSRLKHHHRSNKIKNNNNESYNDNTESVPHQNFDNESEKNSYEERILGEELTELEQYEKDDCLGELISMGYGRRSRREGIISMTRSMETESWETNGFLSPSHLNQNTLSSISDESKSLINVEPNEKYGLKKYAKLILPHVGLVVITCAYTLIGASIFYSVENPNELVTKRRQLNMIYARQAEFVSSLVRLASTNQTVLHNNWTELARIHMHEMSDQLFIAFDKYFLTSHEVKGNTIKEIWTFPTALFFSVTVVTTIGYGNPVPVTHFGRMMCISFSLFGIPLTLVTIADMGKFLSERLIWAYRKYLQMKRFLCMRIVSTHKHKKLNKSKKDQRERVCDDCHSRGISDQMHVIEEQRIPALLVFGILVLYTALGGVLMSYLEPWSFFTSFYWSFITMTTVGFGDLMPRREQYMYIILLYIILGLAITTMCIDLVGVQYIRKIHYFGRKIQDARSALAVVGGKVVLVSELYANLLQKRARSSARDTFVIKNINVSKHIIPFIPSDIRFIRYIDQPKHRHRHHQSSDLLSTISTRSTLSSLQELSSCRFCHSRFSISKS